MITIDRRIWILNVALKKHMLIDVLHQLFLNISFNIYMINTERLVWMLDISNPLLIP